MEIMIKRDKSITDKVLANKIHGRFPYKAYLQIQGNSLFGEYIAVISSSPIGKDIDRIIIQLEDKISSKTKQLISNNAQGMRPNTVDGTIARYKVKEVSVLDIGQKPLLVFRPVKTEEIQANAR